MIAFHNVFTLEERANDERRVQENEVVDSDEKAEIKTFSFTNWL